MTLNTPASSKPFDRDALVTEWFQQHQAALGRYLGRLLGDEERAAELVQETFLRAFAALGRQAPPEPIAPWLYRVASNLAYDVLRRRKLLSWLRLRNDDAAPGFDDDVATTQSVRACLARLRPKEAEALLLYEYAGMSCAEIAALADEEPTAVRMRIHRARAHFRELYKRELS
jgi:RNA polymerase sigma-70 factor, ECF subfamily